MEEKNAAQQIYTVATFLLLAHKIVLAAPGS